MYKKLMMLTLLLSVFLMGSVADSSCNIPTFQELMNPDVFPEPQFGMQVQDTQVDKNCFRVETTGSVMEMDYESSSLLFSQKIFQERKVLEVKIHSKLSKPKIKVANAGLVFAKFQKGGFDFRVNGDSLYMIHAKKPVTLSLHPQFIPIFDGNYLSNHLLLDEFGGFGVYCSIPDLPNYYDKMSKTVAIYDLPADSVLWIAICPPKSYDWNKSINDNVLWHWSTITSYPDNETIESWIPYGNTVLFQGEIMLWKDWNLEFEPRLGMEEWNRVKNTLHKNDMKYMVYTSPYYFLRGTDYEDEAVNTFENFKGWPENKTKNGENLDLFLQEISGVMKKLKPDGLYFDGTYRENLAAQYKLARSTRAIIGDDNLFEWHSTLAYGKSKFKDLCYLPQVDAYADYILRGEHLSPDFDDLNHLRYYVSGYNSSNSIGVFCTRDHRFVTPQFCDTLLDNNARLHLSVGKENLRMKKYSGWVYQTEPLNRYVEHYLSKIKPALKEKTEELCRKRQEEFEKQLTVKTKNN